MTYAENRLTEEVETGIVTVTVAQAVGLPVGYLYNLEDSSNNLASASTPILNGAINIGATSTSTVSQATIVQQAQNTGTKSILALSDTAANIASSSNAVLDIVVGGVIAVDAATIAQATTVAAFTKPVTYNVIDVAANIIAGAGLNEAVNVTVIDDTLVDQATIVEAAQNTGEKSVATLSDTVANISGSSNAVLNIVTGVVTAINTATVAQASTLAAFNKQVIYNITDQAALVLGAAETPSVLDARGVLTTSAGVSISVAGANTLLGLSGLGADSTWNISDLATNMVDGRALNVATDISVQTVALASEAATVGAASNAGIISFQAGISDGYAAVQSLLTTAGGLRALAANTSPFSISAVGTNENDTIDMSSFTAANNPSGLNISGLGNDDAITGSAGADIISGGEGNDSITGGAGEDRLLGDAGEDTFHYASAAELRADALVDGGADTDTITMNTFNAALTLDDPDFANVINMERLDFTGTGSQSVTLGEDSDIAFATGITITTNAIAASLNLQGASSTVSINATGTDHTDILVGGSRADTLVGGEGNDSITGGAGEDHLTGGAGEDHLLGDAGVDTFHYASAAELRADALVDGGADTDTITMNTVDAALTLDDPDFANVINMEMLDLTGTGSQSVTLGEDSDIAFATGITITANAIAASLNLQGAASTVSINATGTDHADILVGGSRADTLVGGEGNDTITSGAGADHLIGGVGEDHLTGGAGEDSLTGDDGDDTFHYALAAELRADNLVDGGADTDTIVMSTGEDVLMLGPADFVNVINMEILDLTGTGSQSVTLGEDSDAAFATGITITTNAIAANLNLQGAASTVSINATGTSNADSLVGGTASDTLVGGEGNDTITGGAGADHLTGGAGEDRLLGDAGEDTFNYASATELRADALVDGGADTDTITMNTVDAALTLDDPYFANVINMERLDFTGTGSQSVTLGEDSDIAFATGITITTNAIAASLNLQGGASTVSINATGTDHADILIGGSRADTLVGGEGNDTITGGAGADHLIGGVGEDHLTGGVGEDRLTGGDGDDTFHYALAAELRADVLVDGGADTDMIVMSTGEDVLTLGPADFVNVINMEILDLTGTGIQSVTLGEDSDAAFATGITITTNAIAASFNLLGGASTVSINATGTNNDDTLVGGTASDTLVGGEGNDTITGGAGGDHLTGGAGEDSLTGEDGDDVFRFTDNVQLGEDLIVSGGSGIDTIEFLFAIDTLTSGSPQGDNFQADFSQVSSVEWVVLSGASKVNLGDVLKKAGVTTIFTGNENTTLRYDNNVLGVLSVDATALDDNKTLTLTQFGDLGNSQWFAVNHLKGDVDATNLEGAISVTAALDGSFDVVVRGGQGEDTLTGGDGSDVLAGGAGNDSITGGAGNDTITGGAGADVMTGGAGADVFAYTGPNLAAKISQAGDIGSGLVDVITDFNAAEDSISIGICFEFSGVAAEVANYAAALITANETLHGFDNRLQVFQAAVGSDGTGWTSYVFLNNGVDAGAHGAIQIGINGAFSTSALALSAITPENFIS